MALMGCQIKNKWLKLTRARVKPYHAVSPQHAADLKVLLIIHMHTYMLEKSKHEQVVSTKCHFCV